ncbi:BZ3500_MvSof-1268-A1-R1_Chr6-1g08406 [Microbotryum saponariae]|uniref:BZ3500_MvSof-1268-A1-R1_Chr6-1g08406 protein n=1 Tax=Microbotryum saponariae TaxID=289078 RepID=A0A2X0KPU6_9BASI|nr:BZ3500_MvSof-1268-A1-R1_Chr6-1g08406 [Microbotryum saponariae]SDA07690.1 BZ3501_MvSof-1269-A2-R1_Chr6-1g08127 [Microbotryum saponariae]
MPVDETSLRASLEASYPEATHISYEVLIVSPSFEGKTTLKRHREVNEKLKSAIAELHAFTQRTLTPKQYEQQVQAETNAA